MTIAHLHSSVAGHVAAQLFLIHSAVHVAVQGNAVAQVALAHVQSDEAYVGIHILHFSDGTAESIAGHHDDVVAVFHSGFHHGNTLSGGVAIGLVILEVNAVGLSESLAGFIGGLVEGLVSNVAIVSDHCDTVGGLIGSSKRNCAQCHRDNKQQRDELLHILVSSLL